MPSLEKKTLKSLIKRKRKRKKRRGRGCRGRKSGQREESFRVFLAFGALNFGLFIL
jgi:hypothetical protein